MEGPPRILVVDDQAANLRVLDLMVRRLGYACDCASDGLAAVERIASGDRYAAVLMDGQMPRLDGYDATERIRKLCAGEGVRMAILALTAAPTDLERMRAAQAGMDDVLEKPITLTMLREKLALWVEAAPIDPRYETHPSGAPSALTLDLRVLADAPGFDANVLRRLSLLGQQSGEGVAEVVVALVLRELPQQVIAIEGALARRDLAVLRPVVHKLTGTARNVGAVALAELCVRAERRLHEIERGHAEFEEGCCPELLREAARVERVLRQMTETQL